MSYARIDDLLAHQKPILEAGRSGPILLGWHLAGHQYAERHRTDGVIPKHGLRLLIPGAGRPARGVLAKLQAAGLWRPLSDGAWQLTDYLDWNEPIASRSAQARKAARTRWDRHAAHDAPHDAPDAQHMPHQVPAPTGPPSLVLTAHAAHRTDGDREDPAVTEAAKTEALAQLRRLAEKIKA